MATKDSTTTTTTTTNNTSRTETQEVATVDVDAPEHFICPLTMDIMIHPLTNRVTGQTFEREAINNWMYFQGKGTCPMTRKAISPSDFFENRVLSRDIQKWKEEHSIEGEDQEQDDDNDSDDLGIDDEEFFNDVMSSIQEIQALTNARRRHVKRNNSELKRLTDLGAKVLNDRDERLKRANAQKSSAALKLPARPVESIFEMYV